MLGFRISGHQIDFSSENSVSVDKPLTLGAHESHAIHQVAHRKEMERHRDEHTAM